MAGCNSLYCLTFLLHLTFISEIISDIGTALFYHVTGVMDDNVMNYQPTMQFFTSCIDILGKVSNELSYTIPLPLKEILD